MFSDGTTDQYSVTTLSMDRPMMVRSYEGVVNTAAQGIPANYQQPDYCPLARKHKCTERCRIEDERDRVANYDQCKVQPQGTQTTEHFTTTMQPEILFYMFLLVVFILYSMLQSLSFKMDQLVMMHFKKD